jgi:hypothetical protein
LCDLISADQHAGCRKGPIHGSAKALESTPAIPTVAAHSTPLDQPGAAIARTGNRPRALVPGRRAAPFLERPRAFDGARADLLVGDPQSRHVAGYIVAWAPQAGNRPKASARGGGAAPGVGAVIECHAPAHQTRCTAAPDQCRWRPGGCHRRAVGGRGRQPESTVEFQATHRHMRSAA